MVKKVVLIILLIIPLIGLLNNRPRRAPVTAFSFTHNEEAINSIHFSSLNFERHYLMLNNFSWIIEEPGQPAIGANPREITALLNIFSSNFDLILTESNITAGRLHIYGLDFNNSLIININGHYPSSVGSSLLVGFRTARGNELFALHNGNVYRIELALLYSLLGSN
ncbi:MAG: hypothetical protein FWE37_05100 [Spirochaetaceae bacterium]|nr:hypothetical protein [Spirochaetaceae bacterium]